MKLTKFSFSFFIILLLFSCGKDDTCDATSLSNTIIGTWDVQAAGQSMGEVEFQSDGTLIDEDDTLISGEINGTILDEKSYEVTSDEVLTVRAASGSNFIDADLSITSFECDRILGEVFGIEITFQRK